MAKDKRSKPAPSPNGSHSPKLKTKGKGKDKDKEKAQAKLPEVASPSLVGPKSSDADDELEESEVQEGVKENSVGGEDIGEGEEDESDENDDEDDETQAVEAIGRIKKLLGKDVEELEKDLEEFENMESEESDEEDGKDGESEEEEDEMENEERSEQAKGKGKGTATVEGVNEDESEEDEDDEEDDEDEDSDEPMVSDDEGGPVENGGSSNQAALEKILKSTKTNADFFEIQTLTYPEKLNVPDADDDLQRELEFYKQSLWAAKHSSQLFTNRSPPLPFFRPPDFFAEMLKSDSHMATIRQKLVDETAQIEASERAKKLRMGKKFGKKVQVEREKERAKEKKEVLDRVKDLRKKRKKGDIGGDEDFDIALEDAFDPKSSKGKGGANNNPSKGGKGSKDKARMPRSARDAKFGRPKTSRRPKENDKKSHDAFGMSGGGGGGGGKGKMMMKPGKRGLGGGKTGKKVGKAPTRKRLGKSRRK